MEWYEHMGRPKYVVAPMVDASELAWRMLCRRHGATLCYTPMLHSNLFNKDTKYRKENFTTCEDDRPLVVQFCGNDPEILAAAAKLVENQCDAIDINLGCPQSIAKRGKYGSFLQDEWELLMRIVKTMSNAVSVPITCKIRVFNDIEKSIAYAKMLQDSGCKMLTVHGRTREQKGPLTGVASWKHIKAIREAVTIPMFANGNIQCLQDVHRCIEFTNVDGVMSAEGILTNPAIFNGVNSITWDIAIEYLDLVEKYPCPTSFIRGHLFKIFHKMLTIDSNNEERQILATAQCMDNFRDVCNKLKAKYLPYHEGQLQFENNESITRRAYDLILPPWICQPLVRISPEEHIQKMDLSRQKENNDVKRAHADSDGNIISRKRMKKLRRIMRRPVKHGFEQPPGRTGEICFSNTCSNPLGGKCSYQLCKKCCRDKCFQQELDCKGHRILVHTRREMARKYAT